MTAPAQRGGIQDLIQRTSVLEIVGDMIRVRANEAALGDLAEVENVDGATSTARVVGLDHDVASLQVFAGGKGLSTQAKVRFLGHPFQVTYSDNILGRIFNGAGVPIDGRPELPHDLIDSDYDFTDRTEARDFFTEVTSLYKNWNYSAPDSPDYERYRSEITRLADQHRTRDSGGLPDESPEPGTPA